MTIYIDSEYHCYAEDAEGRTPVQHDFFDGKIPELIECYKYVPPHNGHDLFIQAWKSTELAEVKQQSAEMEEALKILLGEVVV